MKVAITGASGQLGTSIVEHLIPILGKESIVGTSRSGGDHILGIELYRADYNNKADFEVALKEVEVVLIVSASGEPKARVQQHVNVLQAARQCGVRKVVYTSILPDPSNASFNTVINSNRQTESDIIASGMEYIIGRNGIYIEPDLEYIDEYKKENKITNCADQGKCAYTSRDELGYAYAQLITSNENNSEVLNLSGENITQVQLADLINRHFGTHLIFENVSVAEYKKNRQSELGDFMGEIISGIYHGIKNGDFDLPSHYELAAGRKHKSLDTIVTEYKRAL